MGGKRPLRTVSSPMLRARLIDDFKGVRALLIWGDNPGMCSLLRHLSQLGGSDTEITVGEGQDRVTVYVTPEPNRSHVSINDGLSWECSTQTLELTANLLQRLQSASGHQYVDADGEVEEVVISANEYPADLR
jgi:hypothetical protein